MPKYVIEREVPGAGSLTPEQLKSISQTSCSVLSKLGCEIQWIQSFITGDKIYCIYRSSNEKLIREHAQLAGSQPISLPKSRRPSIPGPPRASGSLFARPTGSAPCA